MVICSRMRGPRLLVHSLNLARVFSPGSLADYINSAAAMRKNWGKANVEPPHQFIRSGCRSVGGWFVVFVA